MQKPIVLFVCTGNSARSQMAEGLLRKYAGDWFDARSAGTEPKGLNPLALEAMQEPGSPARWPADAVTVRRILVLGGRLVRASPTILKSLYD